MSYEKSEPSIAAESQERWDAYERSRLRSGLMLLCLYELVQDARRTRAIGGRLKAMKLAYLAERELRRRSLHGFDFVFYRWTYGPISNEVYRTWSSLCRAGLMGEEELLFLTSRGSKLAKAFCDEVLKAEPNIGFFQALKAVAEEYGRMTTEQILGKVYELREVKQAHKGGLVLGPPLAEEKISELFVDEGWLETMAVMLDINGYTRIRQAELDAAQGLRLTHEDVWGLAR